MERGTYSFEQWCIDNNKEWWLEVWREDLNGCTPNELSFRANKKCYFHCGNPKHKPQQFLLSYITSGRCKTKRENFCIGCKSVAEYLINNHGFDDEKLSLIWSDKNDVSPYEISAGSAKDIWLKCLNDSTHPDYTLKAYNVKNSYNCPYCAGKQICLTNSLGYLKPEVLEIWSEKNEFTPFDFTIQSNDYAWFKCKDAKHDDYKRMICASYREDYLCPTCGRENRKIRRGAEHPSWNPNLSEDKRIRKSEEYSKWRKKIFEKDNYTCQCCGGLSNRLNAHHINSYAKHKNLRFDINNGMTLCENCHDATIKGSLHNVYGTRDISPEILEKYINDTRRENGISIPFSLEEYHNGINILTHNNEVNTA